MAHHAIQWTYTDHRALEIGAAI